MKLEQKENSYFITLKKSFENNEVGFVCIKQAFDFAYKMVYEGGFHRAVRSGGEIDRTDAEIFQNTFQGKIAEIVLYDNLKLQNIEVEIPDFSIHGKGIWDQTDLKANGKSICVKSAAFFANLFLLETKDWDSEGRYIHNLKNSDAVDTYDYFVLVRIKPDIKFILKEVSETKENLWQEIQKFTWFYDIPGCGSLKTIQYSIENQYIIPKNALLNGRTKMDARNYYIQSGNLHNVTHLYSGLREK